MYCIRDCCCDCSQFDRDLVEQHWRSEQNVW